MTNKEALTTVLKMAENLYNKDKLYVFPWQHCMRQCVNHILQNDLEITSHQQEALYQMNDYLTDVMED
tara:strand:+ start:153 stop:356 length:204 start_codon:yes stop_codon:yes gene_type:complete